MYTSENRQLQLSVAVLVLRKQFNFFCETFFLEYLGRPLLWEVILRQPPSVVAALAQSEATKSRKQGNLLQGAPHHTIGPDTTLQ